MASKNSVWGTGIQGNLDEVLFRPRDMVKMKEASESIIQWMNSYRQKCQMSIERSLSSSPKPPSQTYDVFISYCHANKTKALKVLEALKHCKPDLNIFIDTTELKTGTSWQQTLYTALGKVLPHFQVFPTAYLASSLQTWSPGLNLPAAMDHSRQWFTHTTQAQE